MNFCICSSRRRAKPGPRISHFEGGMAMLLGHGPERVPLLAESVIERAAELARDRALHHFEHDPLPERLEEAEGVGSLDRVEQVLGQDRSRVGVELLAESFKV